MVVTGMGLRSPIGNTLADFSRGLREGASGIRKMPDWKWIEDLRPELGGVCDVVEDDTSIPRKYRRSMGRVSIMAAQSAVDAVKDSGLSEEIIASPACGVSYGSTAGSTADQVETAIRITQNRSLKGVQASTYLRYMAHTCAANLATFLHTQGPLIASTTACVSGSHGVGFGYQNIKDGRAEVMVTGGAEEQHWMNGVIFDLLMAASTAYNDRPDLTPRPFDADRDGLVVSEGAGVLILEDYEHARRRGARIHAEILGYWTNSSGRHLTNSDTESMEACIRSALGEARLNPEDIEHINAHATATPHGDEAEALAIHNVFGGKVPVTAPKGHMGHTLGASGALESIATILMAREGYMAPTRNLVKPDPKLPPLDHVMGAPRDRKFTVGINNNFAFGGVNTSLIFKLI